MLYLKVQLQLIQLFEWNEKLQKDEILVREIIDIDTNYMEEENSSQDVKR